MDWGTIIPMVLSFVFALIAMFLGVRWRKAKALLKEIVMAIEDDKITGEEAKMIGERIKELFGKSKPSPDSGKTTGV